MNIWIKISIVLLFGIIIILFLQHQIICNDIYNQEDIYTHQYVLKKLLGNSECEHIIQEAESFATKNDWSKKRHDNYPTTDNQITESWECYKFLEEKIENILFPLYQKNYNIDPDKLYIDELFIAKYDANSVEGQKSLEAHTDGSEFSFIIALNDEYEGGGTRFIEKDEIVKCKKGDCVLFCGQTKHEGLNVYSGTRYILAGFLKYGLCLQHF